MPPSVAQVPTASSTPGGSDTMDIKQMQKSQAGPEGNDGRAEGTLEPENENMDFTFNESGHSLRAMQKLDA